MKSTSAVKNYSSLHWIIRRSSLRVFFHASSFAAPQSEVKNAPVVTATPAAGSRSFNTAQQAADALVDAAQKFDVGALTVQIIGPGGDDIILSGEFAQDRQQRASDFVAKALEKKKCFRGPEERESLVRPRRQRGLAVLCADCEAG